MQELRLTTSRGVIPALSWGAKNDPALIMLHGFPDTPHSWDAVATQLAAQGHYVVAPWMRGYHPEHRAGRRTPIGVLAADAVAVAQAVNAQALVGHDWGALAANCLAAHPDSPFLKVASLSVPPLGCAPVPQRNLREFLAQLRRSWYIGFLQFPALGERRLEPLITRLWADWSPSLDAASALGPVFDAVRGREPEVIGYYRALGRPAWSADAEAKRWHRSWRGVPRLPILYLHGVEDGCMGVDLVDPSRIPGRTQLVQRAGHFLQLEQPDVVARAIAEYLA